MDDHLATSAFTTALPCRFLAFSTHCTITLASPFRIYFLAFSLKSLSSLRWTFLQLDSILAPLVLSSALVPLSKIVSTCTSR